MSNFVYFHAGDIVTLKQKLPNKPLMLVVRIPKAKPISVEGERKPQSMLLGVTCCWFTKDGLYQEKTFNTKDLEIIPEHLLKD
jgi:hypothetical protein